MFVGTNKKQPTNKGMKQDKRIKHGVFIYKGEDGKYFYCFTQQRGKFFDEVSDVDITFDACQRLNERTNGHK